MRSPVVIGIALATVLGASCVDASFEDGSWKCGPGGACPSGTSCGVDGRCRKGAAADGGLTDAGGGGDGDVRDGAPAGDGAPGDTGISADASPCVPSTNSCTGDTLTVCSATGAITRTDTCALGCAASADRCKNLDPSNNLAVDLDAAATANDVVLAAVATPTTINSTTGDVIHNGAPLGITSVVRAQTGAPSIRVFQFKSLIIRNRVVITGANAVAFVSQGPVEIAAPVVVAGRYDTPGPGAITAAAACHGANTVPVPATYMRIGGAGGAGHGTAGGIGGTATRNGTDAGTTVGGAAGMIAGTVDLVPLRGGCRGGSVLYATDLYWQTLGGGGGGAIQIASNTSITFMTSGLIDAGGGGSRYGKSGAAGGSGGGILLEAPVVTVNGSLAANGGAGGCFNIEGEDGQVAYRAGALEAIGGNCTEANGIGDGGNGGTKDRAPTNGGSISYTGPAVIMGGGGGGAAGRIRVNTRSGTFMKGGTSLVSPLAVEGPAPTR